tara:strand:+ start:196 stop:366 length:171 start_codon:yes stop_codon:yes gene_type:complete
MQISVVRSVIQLYVRNHDPDQDASQPVAAGQFPGAALPFRVIEPVKTIIFLDKAAP